MGELFYKLGIGKTFLFLIMTQSGSLMGAGQGNQESFTKNYYVGVFQGAIFAARKGFIKIDFEIYILRQRKRKNNKKTEVVKIRKIIREKETKMNVKKLKLMYEDILFGKHMLGVWIIKRCKSLSSCLTRAFILLGKTKTQYSFKGKLDNYYN